MELRKRIMSLALIPALGLFTTTAFADVSGPPNISGNLITPTPGEIKNKNQCGDATFFKNAFPSLTNGSPGGTDFIDFIVDGKTVRMDIEWYPDNSFDFTVSGGYASRVGVTVDTNRFIYDYADILKGVSDTNLGLPNDDVNHLDLCLKTLDSDPPGVSVRVEPSSDGTTVFGTISIIAEITDESQPDLTDFTITIVDANGIEVTPQAPLLTGPVASAAPCLSGDPNCSVYTWSWDTNSVSPGTYTITIGAIDTSVLRNPGSGSIIVTVSVENCLEGSDGPGGNILGCNPTGFMFNELPNELGNTNLLDGQTLTQAAVPAFAGAQDDTCGGPVDPITLQRPFPFVARDPRWSEDINGNAVYDPRQLDLSEIFDLEQVIPAPVGGVAVMRADTRGEPCLALLYGDASFNFAYFYDPANFPNLEGSQRYTYTLTQLPEVQELGLPLAAFGVGPLEEGDPDLQKTPEATYQTTDRFIETFIGNELGPFTFEIVNPIRVKTPDFSYYALGTVQICEELLGTQLVGRAYYEAVLQCKTDLAVEYFDDLDTLLAYVGVPSPNYPQACLINPSAENLRVDLNRARSMIKVGDWTKATARLNDLLLQVLQADWLVDDRNCPGHVEMRVRNLLWRTDQLMRAEGLLPLQ